LPLFGNLPERAGLINLVREFLYFEMGYYPLEDIPGRIEYCPGPGTFLELE